jgi:hypothetical protein
LQCDIFYNNSNTLIFFPEYCSESPNCSDRNFVTDTEFRSGGELFDIHQLVNGGTFSNLRYDITSKHGNLFAVNPVTGTAVLFHINQPNHMVTLKLN